LHAGGEDRRRHQCSQRASSRARVHRFWLLTPESLLSPVDPNIWNGQFTRDFCNYL